MSVVLRPESAEDLAAARRVHQRAFPTAAEADLVDALRAERAHSPSPRPCSAPGRRRAFGAVS